MKIEMQAQEFQVLPKDFQIWSALKYLAVTVALKSLQVLIPERSKVKTSKINSHPIDSDSSQATLEIMEPVGIL